MFVFVARPLCLLLCACAMLGPAAEASSATLPPGFSETALAPAGTLPNGTAMQFASDGRLFVCQQTGQLRVIENGVLLATPFLSVNVDANGERGLLGVTFDPNFASNQFVYVYYTVPGAAAHNRISRFTANGNVAVPGSEVVIMDLDPLSGSPYHNGGALAFGPDGKLYVAVGDDFTRANAQSLANRFGKMLRLNPDGSIPSDNPTSFPAVSGSPTGQNRAIWAIGVRNPFTFAFNAGPGAPAPTMLINDVGEASFEEINEGVAGANYGWPATEGPTNDPSYRAPRYAYGHSGGAPTGCAITGGAFYRPAAPTFPAEYLDDYFFADYCSGWIQRLDTATNTVVGFATGGGSPVDLEVGDDGALYYLSRASGTVFVVQAGAVAPSITSHPANHIGSPGQPATFTVTATGTAPLTYRWRRDGVDIAGAGGAASSYTVANPQPADSGAQFTVAVSNAVGTVFSNAGVLTVTSNVPPVAAITTPAAGLLYAGGMTVTFAGTGTDPDGTPTTLPASAFTWRVDFHHDTHTHPVLLATTGITSGSFVVPASGETSPDVWYRIHLTVTDPGGLTHSVERDVFPRKVRLTLDTSPSGLQVRLDGQPVSAPVSVDSVAGVVRTIAAPAQTAAGASYEWTGWSDGGAAAHAVTPTVDTTYAATFQAVVAPSITSHPANHIGSPGQPATFTVTATGTAPLAYRWRRDGVDIAGAGGAASTYTIANPQPADSGAQFTVAVSNAVGTVFSNAGVLTVTSNVPPVAAITTPAAGLLYAGGMTVTFAGTGTDPDGTPTTLPASAFTWRVDFHHDTHTHPVLLATTGITSGSFVVPASGETSPDVWYRIHLTVTDPGGLTHSVERDVFPRKVRLTLDTSPSGLQVRLDGQPVSAPVSVDSVAGVVRTIAAPAQTAAGASYEWTGWSDGGAATHAVTPTETTTLAATFQAVSVLASPPPPASFTAAVNGASLHLSWARSVGAETYILEAGTAPGLANLVNRPIGDVTSIEGLVPPRTYYVRLRAANAAGSSAASAELQVEITTSAACVTAPPPPTGYTAHAGGLFLALAWTASPGATAYLLDAGLSSGATSFPPTHLGGGTAYQGVAPPGTYYTRLRAANTCGVSAPSAEVRIILQCSPTAVVPARLAVTITGGMATLTWLPPLGATGYRLLVGSASGVANLADVSVGAATTLPVALGGVPAGTYFLRVAAESACGVGAPSNEVSLTVP